MKELTHYALYALCAILAYLLGSVNISLIISNGLMNKDIRKYGSGNAGTTNMLRVFGWQYALVTFICDILKGVIAVYFARMYGGEIGAFAASIAVVAGHNWPVYYGFKGGKGIATSLGVFLVYQPWLTLALFVLAILLILSLRMVSVASIAGAFFSLVGVFIFYTGGAYLLQRIAVTVLAAFAIYQHRANIKRIIEGKENKISFSSSSYIIKETKDK